MTDKEILTKHIDLDNSCLKESEKLQVRDVIYEYREAFSLRDKIGTCPNIEIDLDVMDKIPFLSDHIMLEKKIREYWIKR